MHLKQHDTADPNKHFLLSSFALFIHGMSTSTGKPRFPALCLMSLKEPNHSVAVLAVISNSGDKVTLAQVI